MNDIIIRGARENNLKNIDLTLPRNKLIVLTGVSGSGKSSLAFDTLYAEGQRRYMESLSSYARMFIGQMEKPDVDKIDGLSPAISIDQKSTGHNPRSTVGTVTEIHDYLRLLYARCGVPHCPDCGREIQKQTIDQVVDQVLRLPEGTRIQIIAPIVRARKGEHERVFARLQKEGFVRVRVDGEIFDISEVPALDKKFKHTVEAVIDRLVVKPEIVSRLTESLETAFRLADNLAIVSALLPAVSSESSAPHTDSSVADAANHPNTPEPTWQDTLYSQNYACADCGVSLEELTPRAFSFNSPFGACPECSGLGNLFKIDPDLIIPDQGKSLSEGAVTVNGWKSTNESSFTGTYFHALTRRYGGELTTPFRELPEATKDALLYGSKKEKLELHYEGGTWWGVFEGLVPNLERRYKETQSEYSKREIEAHMSMKPCPLCRGQRLKKESRAVTVGGMNLAELSALPVLSARAHLADLRLSQTHSIIAAPLLRELGARLGFLENVGLGYLTLSRAASTLSGGEAQRIRLATQIGSGLVGVLYILDEPSIGLHQRDNQKLITTLKGLRDLGNTVIVVEHDEETMRSADYLVDIGSGAGTHGGQVVAQGTPQEVMDNPDSLTGLYLSGVKKIDIPNARRAGSGNILTVRNARANNLKNITVDIPLAKFVCVTGVSGSGKSSLVNEIIKKSLLRSLNRANSVAGPHDGIDGIAALDKVVDIDQSPIGRTPRSNPATYVGLFDLIRELFSQTPDAKMRGYGPGRFSFNVKGGRCEHCGGDGIQKIEMHFLPDIYVPCEVCRGKRYNRETLEVRYKGKNIHEILEMTIEEALTFFGSQSRLKNKLQTLFDVGLGYVKLGQPSTQLSGGEAQRVKLASELSRRNTGRTLYILDEPTTGLHADDVSRLLQVLHLLADSGSTVLVIEHNLDVIKTADHIIDLGPEGGDEGGQIVCTGTPEEVAAFDGSYTGAFLMGVLEV
ncbi:MAG: excinuclease ABC subunit UvrA [Clostridiales bacterium]|nr:excinuclease ABC subunit UvrA [Clostridiales bacterium]